MTLKDKVKACRKKSGLSQAELGDRLGVGFTAVSKWERGIVTEIPPSRLRAMADLFQVPVSYFLDNEDPLTEKKNELINLVQSLSEEEVDAVLRILKR